MLSFFFRRPRSTLTQPNREGVEIPKDWNIDYLVGLPIKHGFCSYLDIKNGTIGWSEIWEMHDMIELFDYVDWKSHAMATEKNR